MPLYEYFCGECCKQYEVIIKLDDLEKTKDAVECPHCKKRLIRLVTAPFFVVRSSML